ncbi:MAG: hypothetical protein J6K88_03890 [Oscillospiraceae bacterium]|nr:hypothetical protein [Oscillospiraceae bacterium]
MSETSFFTYKGRPLVRSGNTIYYGKMSDQYVIVMQIMASEKKGDVDVATRVIIQLWLTDESIPLQERIQKTSEKQSLYDAMDIAAVWLERALK